MANYTLRADGTATSLAAALNGDPATVGECLSIDGYNSYGSGGSVGDRFQLADDGGDYRDTLSPQISGSSGSEIVFEAYSGDTPVIKGSDLVGTWTVFSGSVYQAALTTEPQQVFIDGNFGDRQTSTGACVNEYDWYWASNVLYLYAPGDPDTQYTTPGVEASVRQYCIALNGPGYVDIDGLTLAHGGTNNINGWASSNITVKNCTVEWAWEVGVFANSNTTLTNWLIEDNILRYSGVGGATLTLSGSSSSGHITRRNAVYENGTHQGEWSTQQQWTGGLKYLGIPLADCEVYDNEVYDNGPTGGATTAQKGNGIWFDYADATGANPNICHHNLIYDNTGCGVFIEVSKHAHVWANVMYGNAVMNDNGYATAAGVRIDSRGDREASDNLIYNNTIVGGRYGIINLTYAQSEGCGVVDNIFKNNIVVSADGAVLYCETGGHNSGSYGSGNVYERNCFGAESSNFISWGGVSYSTYDAWLAVSSQEDNNVESDPTFTSAGSDDYTIAEGSSTIDRGEDLGSPFSTCLMPSSSWVDSVVTDDQGDY